MVVGDDRTNDGVLGWSARAVIDVGRRNLAVGIDLNQPVPGIVLIKVPPIIDEIADGVIDEVGAVPDAFIDARDLIGVVDVADGTREPGRQPV